MTYIIRKTDGTELSNGYELPEEVIDTESLTHIGLIGRLTPNYGETQSNNFVHIIENFANYDFPENALIGQLCYKKDAENNGSLYICVNNEAETDDEKWKKLPIVFIGGSKPSSNTSITGDMWYDISNHAFKMYDSSIVDDDIDGWITIGPDNYNDTKSVINEDKTTFDSETNVIEIYDFYNDLKKIETGTFGIGYLITLSVIGKEVNANVNEEEHYIDNCKISGWKIQAVINCYKKNVNESVYEIVDQPDYELIGTNNSDWTVNLYFDENDTEHMGKLKLKVSGRPGNNKNIKWKTKIDMLKVS